MDAISLIEFAIPVMMAFIFSILTLIPKGKDKAGNGSFFSGTQVTLLAAILASISWFIFALVWLFSSTTEAFFSIAYLWMALGTIYALLAVYVGLRMLGSIFETDSEKPLVLKVRDEVE